MWLFAQTGWFVRLLVCCCCYTVDYNRTVVISSLLVHVLLDIDEATGPETRTDTNCKDYCAVLTDGPVNRWGRCVVLCYSRLDELPRKPKVHHPVTADYTVN